MQIIFVFLLNAAVLFLFFHYFKWKITSADFLKEIRIKKNEIAQEINSMIIELNKTAERNLQIIESRIIQLKELNDKSEKIADLLKKNQDDLYNAYKKIEKKEHAEKIIEKSKIKEKIPELFSEQQEHNITENESVKDKVIKMYQNGIDSELIARNLGITSGEVDFIISVSNAR